MTKAAQSRHFFPFHNLREVIDRVGLPPYQDIPGEQAMRNAILEGQPARWLFSCAHFSRLCHEKEAG